MNSTQVLVVGAGPAGLVLACELARRGIAHRLVERDATDFGGARGKGLQPRTQEVFEDLGVLERVRALGGLYPPMRAHRGDQVVWEGRMDELREPTPDVPWPNAWMLPQWRTGAILRERLAELGGSVERGTELLGLAQDAEGVVAVVRSGGQEEQLRADYVVGADGGRSTVRKLVGIGFAGETREQQRMVVADVRAEGLDHDHWHVFPVGAAEGNPYRLALCPLAGTDTFQLTMPLAPEEPAAEPTLSELQQQLDKATGTGTVRLTELVWSSLWRANMRMAEHFSVGRVFLAGDAAHVHSPAGGQGLNTGVQDAYNLGWKLAAVLEGTPAGLLDSYEAERLPVAADVLGISTRLHDKAAAGDADAHRRDDPELQQLNLGYREGPLSQEPGGAVPGAALRAGDRVPDAPGRAEDGSPVRLHQLIGGARTTLLAFGPDAAGLAAAILRESPYASGLRGVEIRKDGTGGDAGTSGLTAFLDAEGHAEQVFGSISGLLVVRPDGYLGLSVAEPDEAVVLDYLGRICAPAAAQPQG